MANTYLSSTNNSQGGGGLKHLWDKITAKFALKSHTHTKSEITDFPSSMPASDVYSWAKASSKPTYDISEITNVTSTLGNTLYPVGSIYLTIGTIYPQSSSPASWLGGTWQKLPEGYALWTASSNAGSTISAGLPNITGRINEVN